MEIPTFRYLTDAEKFLKEIGADLSTYTQLLKKQQQLVASLTSSKITAASLVHDLAPTSADEQFSMLQRVKSKVSPELVKTVIPNLKKLESQYGLAEDLYDKLKAVEQAETQVQLSFGNRRGTDYDSIMAQSAMTKTRIKQAMQTCLEFLASVADAHVPQVFRHYMDNVAQEVCKCAIFRDSKTFMYVTVDQGQIIFTSYLMLLDVANDEGRTTPNLYISVQWRLSESPTIAVDLNHEFAAPNRLIGHGQIVADAQAATKVVRRLLEAQNYSAAQGVVPLAIQMNVDPTTISPQLFDYRDVVARTVVEPGSISFVMRPQIHNPVALTEIAAQMYGDFKTLFTPKGIRLTMKTYEVNKSQVLTFMLLKAGMVQSLDEHDQEYLSDKFSFAPAQLRKLSTYFQP